MDQFDQWRDKTMATRKANEEKKNQQRLAELRWITNKPSSSDTEAKGTPLA